MRFKVNHAKDSLIIGTRRISRITMSGEVVKVKSWEEFKRLVMEKKPNSIVYNIEQNGLSPASPVLTCSGRMRVLIYNIEQNGLSPARELTNLRLIIPCKESYYVFIDFCKGDRLKETGISLRRDKTGNRYIDEKDVIQFLKKQLGENLAICSYWTI